MLHEYAVAFVLGLTSNIADYNAFIQQHSGIEGWMQTAVTRGNWHGVNLRDKVIISVVVEKFRASNGELHSGDFKDLPFDILNCGSNGKSSRLP